MKAIFTGLLLFFTFSFLFSQGPPPPPPCANPPCAAIPLSDNLYLLILAMLGYGVYKLKENKMFLEKITR